MAGLYRDTGFLPMGNVQHRTYPVLSTTTFLKGDFLTFNATGQLQQTITAGNDGGALLYVGQAESNSTDDYGNVRPWVSVVLCLPDTTFRLPEWNTTASSAIFTPGTSHDQVSTGFDLRYQSTTAGFVVNNGGTSNPAVQIIDVVPDDYQPGVPAIWPTYNGAGTTQYPHVFVRFLRAFCLFASS